MGLFKKPSWAKATVPDDKDEDDEKDMFSHSGSYSAILADQERYRKERVERQKLKAEKLGSTQSAKSGLSKVAPKEKSKRGSYSKKYERSSVSPKRRRIGGGNEAGRSAENRAMDDYEEQLIMSDGSMQSDTEQGHNRVSPRKQRGNEDFWNQPTSPRATQAQLIDLGGSSSDEEEDFAQPKPTKPAKQEDIDDESDEELAALARQARERRKHSDKIASATPDTSGASPFAIAGCGGLATPPLPDPTIKLFISSPIPDTQPLVVLRRLSQRLQEARVGWCKKQGFNEDYSQQVYFIYRGRRVYDLTTCRSLGLVSDADGKVIRKDDEDKEGVDRVHLEAVTSELHEKIKKDKAMEELKKSSRYDPEAEAGAQEEAAANARKEEKNLLRLVLKAKSKPDFKLKVKPTTLFSKIENACRKTFGATEGQEVHLEFDGERLESEEQVQNTEIDDMDCVDVYIS